MNDKLRPGDLGVPICYLPAFVPFSFCNQDRPLQEERLPSDDECVEEPRHTHQTSHHDWGWVPQWVSDHGPMRPDLWTAPPPLSSSPWPNCGFKSDRSSVSTSSSVSLRSNRSGGTRCIQTMADATGSLEAIWKSICQSSRTKTWRTPSLIKVGAGT